jgi:hypothetical protein
MREILVKLITLHTSLFFVEDESQDVARLATWNTTKGVFLYAARSSIWYAIQDVARDAAQDEKKVIILGKDSKSIDQACLYAMSNYNRILSSIDKLGSLIELKKNVDWCVVLQRLITFDDDAINKLGLMNRHLRLFYLLRVHEIFSMILSTLGVDNKEESMIDFYKLLKKTGDLEAYNGLFICDVPLVLIENQTSIPRDVAKIIINYSHSSIYNVDEMVDKLICKINHKDAEKPSFNYYFLLLFFVATILVANYLS